VLQTMPTMQICRGPSTTIIVSPDVMATKNTKAALSLSQPSTQKLRQAQSTSDFRPPANQPQTSDWHSQVGSQQPRPTAALQVLLIHWRRN
jgi:hypothetical protein